MLSSQTQHFTIAINTDDTTFGPYHLSSDKAQLPTTGAEIEHSVTGQHIGRWITTTVVPLDHFIGYHRKEVRGIFNGATQGRFPLLGGGGITAVNARLRYFAGHFLSPAHRFGLLNWFDHLDCRSSTRCNHQRRNRKKPYRESQFRGLLT